MTIDVASSDEEDDKTEASFRLADWIGVGNLSEENLPRAVRRARNAARCVPAGVLSEIIPDGKLTVSELLSQIIPRPSSDTQPATFTTDAASAQPTSETPFTSIPFLFGLRSSFNDAWLAGNKSICFPHLPNLRFPLWSVDLLESVKLFLGKRHRWEQARQWLDAAAETVPVALFTACDDILRILPWDTTVPGLSPAVHLTTQDLAFFLSSQWLNDEMINGGVDYILRRLKPGSRIRILNCLFIQTLSIARARSESYAPPSFSAIEKSIRNGGALTIYLPLHINGNHWTLLKADLRSKTVSVADSLRGPPPTTELELVRWWLGSILPGTSFTVVTPNIPSPRQRDSHSCGIIVLSILATILLDEEIWCPAHAQRHRMEWFLRLTESFTDEDDPNSPDIHASDCGTAPDTSPRPSTLSSPSSAESPHTRLDPDDPDVSLPFADGAYYDQDRQQLDDVDFFPDAQPMDIDSSEPITRPNHIAEPITSQGSTSVEHTDAVASISDSEYYASDGEDSDSRESRALHRRSRRHGTAGPKPGSSWDIQKRLNAAAKDTEFRASTTRLGTFRAKILRDDPHAEFKNDDVRRVRCSHCAVWIEMRTLYDLIRWKNHRNTTKCVKNRGSGLSTKSLFTLGFKKVPRINSTPTTAPPVRLPLPCPGLTRDSNEEISIYLARTTVPGGGAPSRTRIAEELFSTGWKDLTERQQRMVLRRELSLQKWKLARGVGAMFSSTCLSDVQTIMGEDPVPCSECRALLSLHSFKVSIHRPMPAQKAMKYVPIGYRDPELGALYLKYVGLRELIELDDGRSPYLKFAQGCADGSFQSDTLTGMIEALVLKQSRIHKGKSLKNIQYPPEFDEFCNLLASTSPRAYLTFQKTFGGRGTRSMRQVRAKLPRFGPGILGTNVARAVDILIKLEYSGPLSLSCDDTALEPAISVFQETKTTCLVLGGIDGPITVTDEDDIDAVLKAAQLKKADKLRVWLLSIPLPKIPPILIAAVARGSSVTAENLAAMHTQMLDLLHEYGIHPVSLASDGAEAERAATRIIANSTTSHLLYGIPNPVPGCTLSLKIPLAYGQYPIIITQDSKHGLKTARNQIFTGARIIVIVFFAVFFSMLRELAANIAGPLFTRDVEKVDKQDDRAAARMFSATTLQFQLKNYPGQTGLSVYLFVLGELIDAWQNRNISHRDRVKMVLRARFFLMAWRSHIIAHPDYSVDSQFISRASFDIFLIICDGLLSLIIVYRKYFPTFPLLPWLHSTEACEHLFGMLRQLKKDFNYSDVLYLERKLRALQMGAFAGLSPEQQATQVSAGYHHTYFNADDLDTATLMQYPTDAEIVEASKYGFEEAAQLLKMLGISAEDMLRSYVAPTPATLKKSMVPTQSTSRAPQTFLELLALYQTVPLSSLKDEHTFETCEVALAAESLDKSLAINALPDSTEESIKELRDNIQTQLSVQAPNVVQVEGPLPASNCALPLVLNKSLNDLLLVSERLRHQTKSTAQAVRRHGRLSTILVNEASGGNHKEPVPSLRQTLIKKLAAVVPTSDTLNKTTGVDRYVRHAGTFGGAGEPANVRVQNKATVQSAAASKFVLHRSQAFAAHQFLHENMYLANITEFNPLLPGHLVIALKSTGKNSSEVVLGEVLTMYTKNTMHDWLPMAASVGSPSYVYIAVYSPIAGHMFTSMSCPKLACGSIIQIPRTHLLFSLASYSRTIQRQAIPTTEGHPHVLLTLCEASSALLREIRANQLSFHSAVAQLVKLTKAKNVESGFLNSASWQCASMMDHVEEQEENEDGGEED
ncbi:hypothetical protein DFH09DRAFT_1372073 [Mycena vulgaris]|nr:hypothetical protein DFH09DRAFT_1372073 [Mycena vulgaris]